MHVYHEFPKWKYHATKDAVIVESPEAESALGSAWVDNPANAVSASEASDLERSGELLQYRTPKTRRAKA